MNLDKDFLKSLRWVKAGNQKRAFHLDLTTGETHIYRIERLSKFFSIYALYVDNKYINNSHDLAKHVWKREEKYVG